jgi:[acyl-carrier-protein] S-malonyltransferase
MAGMSIALVFPGQGSQSVGMMGALAAQHAIVRDCYVRASARLGFDLWQLVAEGPAERLNSTEYTQPAMLVAGVATAMLWRAGGGAAPTAVAGHSLGEFAALVCAGSLQLEDAVELVRYRGQLMQRAVPEGVGAMAAILGLEDDAVEAACLAAAQGEVVEAVNFNSVGQVVIAGHRAAVERAMEACRQSGAKRAQLLPVSVPAHSSLMRAAADSLAARLALLEVRAPQCQYISAVDALPHDDPADIRATLVRQLASPVRWQQTVRALFALAPTLIECGPGKVLTSLNRRIARGATTLAIDDPDSLKVALATASGAVHV